MRRRGKIGKGGCVSNAFYQDLQAVRAEQRGEQKRFVVLPLKKNGTPYSIKTANPRSFFNTQAEAEQTARARMEWNQGTQFVVVKLEDEREAE